MNSAIILFDGECPFCNKWIYFAKSKLHKSEISFFPFKSSDGLKIAKELQIENQNSVVYIQDNIPFFKSRAVLKICKQLQFPYNCLVFSKILPTFLLDFGYDFIAKRRLKLTNNKQCCNGK
jgi:predicted DCC family thiol-disulfide oxidoreductase YuxK